MLPFFKKLFFINTSGENSQDLTHINQEIYKKSLELAERNKTLLLLRKIDEIILSSITDSNEIARRVANVLVSETDFQIASIFLYDRPSDSLKKLAFCETSKLSEFNQNSSVDQYYLSEIPLSDVNNILVQSVKEKISTSSNSLTGSLLSRDKFETARQIQEVSGIRSVFSNPLIVRDQLIGVIVVAFNDLEENISEYTKDLLSRLSQVIGIAIDNASLYTQLQAANEKLKALDKLKDEFVSLASHELRTPMTAVKSYLWMTLKGEAGNLNEKQTLYINRAYTSVERLIKLINDMLNISRIESGRITLEFDRVDLLRLTNEVIDEIAPRAEELGIKIFLNPPDRMSEVLADGDKIKEVLFNLIGNSLKFTERDGEIKISFSEKDGFVETKVADTGSGISAENITKLFKKFNMLPESYSKNKNASGSGLGLYISHSIIELHKGRMWVESEGLGKGSQFYFTLKVFSAEDSQMISNGESKNEKLGIVHTALN